MAKMESGKFVTLAAQEHTEAKELVGRLFEVAQPHAVFSEPVQADEYTLITASEATVSMGFGFGLGGGESRAPNKETEVSEERESMGEAAGSGGGGGGGGFAGSRAVAVISVGPNGVVVQPVVDVTKIALAFFTMFGAFFLTLRKMREVAKS